MKFLIASDIHGSVASFLRLTDALTHEQAQFIILCGDYLSHGPRNGLPRGYDPADLAPLMNQYKEKLIAVRGNCDSEVDQVLLNFPMMSDYTLVFNAGHRCFVTHGHIYTQKDIPRLALVPGDIFISGHTHTPRLEVEDGIVFLNPGSTTFPRESLPGYAVMDDSHIELKKLANFETIQTLDL